MHKLLSYKESSLKWYEVHINVYIFKGFYSK